MIGIPEDKIVWRDGGVEHRLRKVETRLTGLAVGATGGGGAGGSSPGIPGQPQNLEIASQTVVQDHIGQTWIAVTLSWDGVAELWEVAWGEAM